MPLPITATLAVGAAVLAASLILNGLLVTGMRRDKSLRAVTYYYANSVCAAMLLQCLVTVPPGFVADIVGEQHKSLLDTLCIVWLYMDTFLCNLVFLHCLGSAIDTWLRLCYPMSYSHSTGSGSTCLKIGAPWSVSFIQTTAEFAVSRQFDDLYQRGGACLHSDPNFVILRAGMSYALPGLASLALTALAFRQFARVRATDGDSEAATAGLMEAEAAAAGASPEDRHNGSSSCRMRQPPQQQQPGDLTMQRDCTAETLLLQPQAAEITCAAPPAAATVCGLFNDGYGSGGAGVFLEMYRMATIPEAQDEAAAVASAGLHIVGSRSCQTLGSGCGGGVNGSVWWQTAAAAAVAGQAAAPASLPTSYTTDRALHRLAMDCATCPRHGRTLAAAVVAASASGAALAARGSEVQPSLEELADTASTEGSRQWCDTGSSRLSNSWRRMLEQERAACTINLCLFFVSSVFWSPYMIASLAFCLCANFPCSPNVRLSSETVADTKWVAYASCLAFPVFFLVADQRLRAAAWAVASCSAVAPQAAAFVAADEAADYVDYDEDDDEGSSSADSASVRRHQPQQRQQRHQLEQLRVVPPASQASRFNTTVCPVVAR